MLKLCLDTRRGMNRVWPISIPCISVKGIREVNVKNQAGFDLSMQLQLISAAIDPPNDLEMSIINV